MAVTSTARAGALAAGPGVAWEETFDRAESPVNGQVLYDGSYSGKSGEGAVKLKNELLTFAKKNNLSGFENLKLDIEEVRSPESNAAIVAHMVAESL